jgi:hypothetical protein
MKKARMSMRQFVGLLILIIFLIAFLGFSDLFAEEAEERTQEDLCKFSVLEHTKLKINGLDFSQEIRCPTQRIIIEKDLRKEQEQKDAKRKIAESMASCWRTFGEGKLNLFQDEGLFCVVCSVIEFKNPKTPNLPGFVDYFYTEKMLKSEETYSEYIVGYKKGDMFQAQQVYSVQEDTMDTSKPYAIMFYYPKGQDYIRKFSETIGASYEGLLIGGGAITLGLGIIKVGAALSMTIIGKPVGLVVVATGLVVVGVSTAIGWFTTEEADEWAAFTYILPYERDKALANCTFLPVKQGEWWKEEA